MLSKDKLIDRIKGMLLLGAYGDALGGYRERAAIDRKFLPLSKVPNTLRSYKQYFTHYPHEYDVIYQRNTWRIWAEEQQELDSMIGIVTDDTSFRFTHLHPWIAKNAGTEGLLIEENFIEELRQSDLPEGREYISGIRASHKDIASLFVDMYEAAVASPPKKSVFFEPEHAIFFGSFMYLELAATKIDKTDVELLNEFFHYTVLDQNEGKTISAILATLLASGLRTESDVSSVFDDLLASGDSLLKLAKELGLQGAEMLAEKKAEALELGEKAKTLGLEFMFNHIIDFYLNDEKLQHYSSIVLWVQFWSSLSYSSDNPIDSLSIIAGGPGDSDTVCSFMGSILGAFYGMEHLTKTIIMGEALDYQLRTIESNLRTLFYTDVDELSQILASYSHNDAPL